MKRINLTIILTILLTMSFSVVSFASGVGGAGEAIGIIEGTKIDPRSDSRYSDKYYFSDNEVNGLKFYDDVVIKYHSFQNDKVYALNAYARIYSSQERFCLYTESYKESNGGDYYNLNYILVEGTQTLITYSYSQSDGSFNFVHNKTRMEPSATFGQRLDYFRQEDFEILECSVPVFASYDDAIYYINTGEVRNAVYEPKKDTPIPNNITAGQIYLEDFQVIYHDAPSLDDCYVEFKYSIPKHLRNVRGSLYLDITDLYRLKYRFLSIVDTRDYEYLGRTGFNVSENPYGFTIPISNFTSIQQVFDKDGEWHGKRLILGNEFYGVDFDNLSLAGEALKSIEAVTKSELYLDIQLRLGSKTLGTNGSKYNARVDFLDLKNCTYNNEPYDDTLKKYVPSDSPIKDGYYSTDGNGNYNYHSSTGDTQTITSYEYDNSTNSTQYITNNYYGGGGGGSGGGNGTLTDLAINVGDIIFNIDIGSIGGGGSDSDPKDFLLPDSTLGALKTGFGFLDNPETEEKGDGFISFLGNSFSFMPDDFTGIIMFGIAVIVVLGIISIILKVVF